MIFGESQHPEQPLPLDTESQDDKDDLQLNELDTEAMLSLFAPVKYGKKGKVYQASDKLSQQLRYPGYRRTYKETGGYILTLDKKTGQFTVPEKFYVVSHFTPEQQKVVKLTNKVLNSLFNIGKIERGAEKQFPPLHVRIIRTFRSQTAEHPIAQKLVGHYLPEPAVTLIDKAYKAYVIAIFDSLCDFSQEAPQLIPSIAATLRMANTEGFERAFAADRFTDHRRSHIIEQAISPNGEKNILLQPNSFMAPGVPADFDGDEKKALERPCQKATLGLKLSDQVRIAMGSILQMLPPDEVANMRETLEQMRSRVKLLKEQKNFDEAEAIYRRSTFVISPPEDAFEEAMYTFANAALHAVEQGVSIDQLNPALFERKPVSKPSRIAKLVEYLMIGLENYYQQVMAQ